MLEQLKFVQRGVARRDFVPGLTHFRIKDKRVTGFNGAYSLSSPVDIGFNVAPHAGLFTKALDSCEEVISLHMPTGDSLMVRSGLFEVAVPCVPLEQVPETLPEGRLIPAHGSLLEAFKSLREFVGVDASRPWATGILLSGESAFATNNVVIAEYWLGTPFPHVVNIPSAAIDEVIRVNEELTGLQLTDGTVTFHYADGRWIKSALLALNWPDVLGILNGVWPSAVMRLVPPGLREACARLAKFGDPKEARLYLRGTDVATHVEGAINGQALEKVPGVPDKGIYHTVYLNQVLGVATHIGFECYPNPVPFIGDHLRGVMLGLKQ